jgi:hypothetical protein
MMRQFLLLCAGLFLGASASGDATFTALDMQHQQRRKTLDIFGFLMMMVGDSECGPAGEVHHGPDCHLLKSCKYDGVTSDCAKLCSMAHMPLKKKYNKFCSMSSSSNSVNAAEYDEATVDAYQGNSSPESVVSDGNYAMGFQFWMVAVAASVGMALVAIHMGQRKERLSEGMEDEDAPGATVAGSVGRRMHAVTALADGMMGGGKQYLEMASYSLEEPYPNDYPQSSFV